MTVGRPQPSAAAGARGRAAEAGGDLLERIAAGGVLARGRPVVVMLSGGRDSVCLLDVAARICGPEEVMALHVNYGLRSAAGSDQRHCEALCERLGVRLEAVAAGPVRTPGNVQAWARELRYAHAGRLARALAAEIAAGHTATDQVETILYRLASSPSRRALLGMRERDGGDPPLIRPLLGVTRAQTAAHCEARGLAWVEDESNRSDAYARGRVRGGLVPALAAVHPAAEANVLTLAEILRGESEVLDELVDEALEGRQEIDLSLLRSLSPALRRLVVQRLADAAARGPAAGVARRADEIAALREGGMLDVGRGVRAGVRGGWVRFGRTPEGLRRPRSPAGDESHEGGRQPAPLKSNR